MRLSIWNVLLGSCLLATTAAAAPAPQTSSPPMRGLPFVRSYSFEDIGDVPRGSRLGFDRFGRVAVIHDAVYAVLNDTVWLNIAENARPNRVLMSTVVQASDGTMYYGGRGTWGVVEFGSDGRVHPRPAVPARVPDWIPAAAFSDIILAGDGVFFSSWNGIVFRDTKHLTTRFLEVPGLTRAFRVGKGVYVSAYEAPLRLIDPQSGALVAVPEPTGGGGVVEYATPLDEQRTLVSFVGGRLAVFDGQRMTPWAPATEALIKGHISLIQRLVDGRVAIGVTGQGLLLCALDGEPLMWLTASEYRNLTAVANREPGVLWVATADSIAKVLYGNPISAFNQQLGLPVSWPIVVSWGGRVMVSSDGKLYRGIAGGPGQPAHFEPDAEMQPPHGAWAMAAVGSHLVIGNGLELYSVAVDGTRQQLPPVPDLAYLAMVDRDHVYAIGRREIAYFELRDGRWVEAAPRIPGLRYPSIMHTAGSSAWIEMGGDGVARVWCRDGKLHADIIDNASWTRANWVNVGVVGNIVVLSSLREQPRRYFDEQTGTWCEQPQLERLFSRSPFWIARMAADRAGVIWATHNEGLVRFQPKGGDYEMDTESFDLMNDRYPIVRVLDDGEVWLSAERALYHIEREWLSEKRTPSKPVIVSIAEMPQNHELLTGAVGHEASLRLPYEQNSLSFRFYSGTDSWRRTPAFEYRLGDNESWSPIDGSVLSLRTLREGNYRLEVRVGADRGGGAAVTSFAFEILPPWTRSWPAYGGIVLAFILVLLGTVQYTRYLAHKRHRMLERLVQERTRQVEATMARLTQETQTTATLAERNRLANEIHDSVQQGLTGAILQLDTTLKLPVLAGEIRRRLDVVRNMISYARQEVQHAVWDMESPLLEGTDLSDALRNLTTFVESGDAEIDVTVSGTPVALSREVNHNLLRIAQEATTNAFRHAHAERISLQLDYGPEAVLLTIRDDGVGFQPDDVLQRHTGHLGLRGIRTRVRKIGGKLTIESAPDAGTTIVVTVPLAASNFETHDAATNWR